MSAGLRYIKGLAFMKSESSIFGYVDYNEFTEKLKADGYRYKTGALRAGYIRKHVKFPTGDKLEIPCMVAHYKGKYGEGYTVHVNEHGTSKYHFVEYWIRENYYL